MGRRLPARLSFFLKLQGEKVARIVKLKKKKSSALKLEKSSRKPKREKPKSPFLVVRGSLFIGGRPPLSSCGNSAFGSLSHEHLRVDCVDFPAIIIRAK